MTSDLVPASHHSPGVRRLCVVVDVEGYSAHSNPVGHRMLTRLDSVLRAGLTGAGVWRRRARLQDRGDGQLIIFPAGVDEARAVPGLVRGLLGALESDRARSAAEPALRLRVAMSQGVVHDAPTGYVGLAVVTAAALVDAEETRSELRTAQDAALCLAVDDSLYQDVVAQGYGGLPGDGYRRLRIVAKGRKYIAWIRALTTNALGPDPTTAAAAAALPLGAAGALVGNVLRSGQEELLDDSPETADQTGHSRLDDVHDAPLHGSAGEDGWSGRGDHAQDLHHGHGGTTDHDGLEDFDDDSSDF